MATQVREDSDDENRCVLEYPEDLGYPECSQCGEPVREVDGIRCIVPPIRCPVWAEIHDTIHPVD